MPLRSPIPARRRALTSLLAVAALAACGPPPRPQLPAPSGSEQASPLGPSYVLLPLPSEDDSLLGRVLSAPPTPGRSLEELARPNPCADKLTEARKVPLASSFEDAQELAAGASARASLGAYGFSGDAEVASHFFYKLETSSRIARTDTTEYVACCKEKGCGYGYISALVFGDGEYATGSESRASGSADVVVASGSGRVQLRMLHRRKVRGYMAALVTVTDASSGTQLGPLGAAVQEATVPDTVKEMYERARVSVSGRGNGFVFTDGSGQAMTENEFVRRFQAATGSTALDPIDSRRNKGQVAALAAGTAVSAGALVYGLLHFKRYCQAKDFPDDDNCAGPSSLTFESDRYEYYPKNRTWNGWSLPYIIGGGLGTAGLGTALVFALLHRDGSPGDHFLSDREAVLYASQYNRAILRRSLRDVQQVHRTESQGPTILPYVTPEGLGVWGRF